MPWKTDGTSVVGVGAKEPATKTMFYDMARQRRDYDRRGPDLAPALQSKLDTFGRSANPYRVPTPPRFVSLIGQHTSRLRIADGDCAVAVDYLSDFSQMNRDGAVVPFEFAGQFEGELPRKARRFSPSPSTGRSGPSREAGGPRRANGWRLRRSTHWRNGTNAAEVFRIEASSSETLLRRCTVREGRSR